MNPGSVARLFIPLAIFLLGEPAAQAVDYTQLDPTGSIEDPHYPVSGAYSAFGINDAGLVVGTCQNDTGCHGYVAALAGISGNQIAAFTTIDAPIPGTVGTHLTGINDDGDLTGWYQDADGRAHGLFIGDYTTLDYPGIVPANFLFRDTRACGVNAADEVVGQSVENVNCDGVIGSHAFRATGFPAVPEPGALSLAMLVLPAAFGRMPPPFTLRVSLAPSSLRLC